MEQQFRMATREEAVRCRKADILLEFCQNCGAIWNAAFEPEQLEYAAPYEAAQVWSPIFRQYLERIAKRLIRKYDLHEKQVVDIGCGDAQFLVLLSQLGCKRCIGFEPSWRVDVGIELPANVSVIPEYYSARQSRPVRPDLIACRHVLEHIDDPVSFLKEIQSLDPERRAVFFLEVPNGSWSFRKLAFWDIYYEHCLYFTRPSFEYLLRSSGYDVLRSSEGFGGQYLLMEGKIKTAQPKVRLHYASEVRRVAEEIDTFKAAYQSTMRRIQRQIVSLAAQGTVVFWGAGAKAVTILNLLKMGPDVIEYVVDVNSRKWGTYLPGTGQEIVPPQFLKESKPDKILVINPQYFTEIRGMVGKLGVHAKPLLIGG